MTALGPTFLFVISTVHILVRTKEILCILCHSKIANCIFQSTKIAFYCITKKCFGLMLTASVPMLQHYVS